MKKQTKGFGTMIILLETQLEITAKDIHSKLEEKKDLEKHFSAVKKKIRAINDHVKWQKAKIEDIKYTVNFLKIENLSTKDLLK